MLSNNQQLVKRFADLLAKLCFYISVALIIANCQTNQQQQDQLKLNSDPLTIDLYHKIGSQSDFSPRGTIFIKPRSEYRMAQASILSQIELSDTEIDALKKSSESGELYSLRATLRSKKNSDQTKPLKTTQTLVRSCSLYSSNLADIITVNLNPLNEFININIHTTDPECLGEVPSELSRKFNTTITVDPGIVGPVPDTATYVKRLEEERQNKAREGKEDNRSFLAKYWIYIVPVVIFLMVFSGPEQGAR